MEGPGECENQLATSDRGPPRSPYHCLIQTRRHYSVLKDGFRTKKGISVNASHQKDISYRICTRHRDPLRDATRRKDTF